MDREETIKKIMELPLNEKLYLNGNSYVKYVYFNQHSLDSLDYGLRGRFSWVAEAISSYSNRTIFPLKNINYVKFFKTLEGAKRNFVRSYVKD